MGNIDGANIFISNLHTDILVVLTYYNYSYL